MKRPHIRLYRCATNGKPCVRFRAVGGNGETVATSEGYEGRTWPQREANARAGVEALRRIMGTMIVVGIAGVPV